MQNHDYPGSLKPVTRRFMPTIAIRAVITATFMLSINNRQFLGMHWFLVESFLLSRRSRNQTRKAFLLEDYLMITWIYFKNLV
jgi:hypothetical protein